jgi:hypothetical protein
MLKCYLKLFFLSGLFFFLGALYADINIMEGQNAVTEALALGAVMGLVISVALGTMHIMRVRRIAPGKRAWDIYSVKQKSELHLPLEPDRAFSLLQQYFTEVAHFNVTGADKIAGTISGRTPLVYFRTLGNSVSADVKADNAGGSLVSITSKPLLPATLTDFGDNLRIVTQIEKYLLASSQLQ